MGKLVIETAEPIIMPETKTETIDDFLASRSSKEIETIKELREAVVMFRQLVTHHQNIDGSITYNGVTQTKEELYDNLINDAKIERRKITDKIVDDYFANFKLLEGSLISNGVTIDIVSDMKERVYRSYDEESKTVEYLPGTRITLNELYLKYRAVNTEEQTELTNAELCEDMLNYIEEEVRASEVAEMNCTLEEYILNKLPQLMHDGTYVEIEGKMMPIEEFVTKMYEHQKNVVEEEKRKAEEELEANLNRTKENPNLVGEISVALNNNNLEVTTEMPLHNASRLDETETASLMLSANISDTFTTDYLLSQISRLKVSINNTTNEQDLKFNESVFENILSTANIDREDETIMVLIESVRDLITQKRNGFIKTNINSEDLIDLTHGVINDWENELNAATSADVFNKLYGKVTALIIDLKRKGIKDIQLEAKIYAFLDNITKKRVIFDSTLTNISQEMQKVKFDLDERMKRIRREILAIECNKPSKTDITGKTVMITAIIDDAYRAVKDAQSSFDTKLPKDSLNYYNSQIEMYRVALDNIGKIGYGYR